MSYALVHLATKVDSSPYYADFYRHIWLCKDVQYFPTRLGRNLHIHFMHACYELC